MLWMASSVCIHVEFLVSVLICISFSIIRQCCEHIAGVPNEHRLTLEISLQVDLESPASDL